MQPYRADYPALIVDGDLRLRIDSDQTGLSEAAWGRNFNPPGADLAGETDLDMTDVLPNEIQGLVHVIGNVEITESSRVRGCMICEGDVVSSKDPLFIHDPALYTNPPVAYHGPTLHAWYREAAP